MNSLYDGHLAALSPEDLQAIKRRAHQQRSEAAREIIGAGIGWLAGVVREAGRAARLSEAPKPYLEARRPPCG
jgi:hypothetical protein